MEEEIKEQIRELVQSMDDRKEIQVVVYIANIQAEKVVIETSDKA